MSSSVVRRVFVLLHRYVGLVITVFLIVVGLTGCLLAFQPELNRILTPHLFPAERPGHPLDLATLVERAEKLAPEARIYLVDLGAPEAALVRFEPRQEPNANGSAQSGYGELFLDPIGGDELGRRFIGTGLPTGIDNLMPFIFRLHYNLSLGEWGTWVLGITALLWTIDCFASLYLTLPAQAQTRDTTRRKPFLSRWKTAWQIKWPASTYRINFDLHRAGGLWTWLALLVFAWSSVYMNLHDSVYAPATRWVFDYPPPYWEWPKEPVPLEQPTLGWRQAHEIAERLMAEQSRLQGFAVEKPLALRLDRARHQYIYTVRSTRDIQERRGRTRLTFDANTGAFRQLQLPTGQYNGTTVTMWLNALHDANVAMLGLPYRIFVSVLGIVIVILSVTGVYIWWKKRAARQKQATRRAGAASNSARTMV